MSDKVLEIPVKAVVGAFGESGGADPMIATCASGQDDSQTAEDHQDG